MLDREERLMRLAGDALRAPITERETFLNAACGNDQNLYDEVSEIVEWEERMGEFMGDPLVDLIDLEGLDRPFKPGEVVLDRFEILREVGDGGMGVVYEAYDRKREQRIAIKCAKLGYERLSPELRSAIQVRHPNVCVVNDIHPVKTKLGELDFLTMEFLDGETLLARLSRGKLAPNEALKFARQLCAGLAEAHRSNVLHRDLKPANVILASGKNTDVRAVITDFGLAADQDGNTDLIGGTPSYMAPELRESGKSSSASDVFALGVMLCEMVTGKKPFRDSNAVNGHKLTPVAPSKLARHVPAIWDDAVLPALAAQPQKRPSAEQVLAVLNRKPLYQRPWVAIAALMLLTAGAFLWRPVYEYLRPADISLALLPVQTEENLQPLGKEVLADVAKFLDQEPAGKPKFHLIPLETAEKKAITTADQARDQLHATHVLKVRLTRDQGDIVADAAIIDTKTSALVNDYVGHIAGGNQMDQAGGIAAFASATLHLPRPGLPEKISREAEAAYNTGLNYLAQDRYSYDKAIEQFQRASHLDPHSPLPPSGLVEASVEKFYVEGRKAALNAAKSFLQIAEQLNSDSPRVLLASASVNTATGEYGKAIQDCSRVLEIDPRNAEAWVRYGFAYEAQKVLDKAQDAYQHAIEADPTYYKPYEYLGALYYYRGKYKEAEQQYRNEVSHAPQKLDGYANLGALLTAQSRYTDAEQVYRSALQIKETPEVLNNLAATLDRQKRDAEAVPFYERAVQLLPTSPIYWINLGDTQRRLGQAKLAATAYQKALGLTSAQLQANPSSNLTRAYMAYCLARLGRTRDAEFELNQAMTSAQLEQQIALRAVLTYEALGNHVEALKVAAIATPDVKKEIDHHPDLAGFNQNSRFTK